MSSSWHLPGHNDTQQTHSRNITHGLKVFVKPYGILPTHNDLDIAIKFYRLKFTKSSSLAPVPVFLINPVGIRLFKCQKWGNPLYKYKATSGTKERALLEQQPLGMQLQQRGLSEQGWKFLAPALLSHGKAAERCSPFPALRCSSASCKTPTLRWKYLL